ncbi:metallophosphoesterase [Inhella gelatinilytica]|uniref:Metallophosphoesterase n=1 Tax=Inhella gelatinilytica TaxID=2795030 RepID=A0A931NCM1_9BURK|nr:metallophosphoesterase [Inhella gelatinilytica]MBH9552167.1 metallophosphoesterase [Inhella gelatinilytica]
MILQLLSDLHLEREAGFQPKAVADAEVLVLAGDIGSYQAGSALLPFDAQADWGLRRFSPQLGAPWRHVLFVPGNHEYDGLPWPEAKAGLAAACERLGIRCLDRMVTVIGGVRFVGCTLWTDFDLLVDPAAPLTEQLRVQEKAFRAANFYLRQYSALEQGAPMLAPRWRDEALIDQAWLRETLAQPFDGVTVVITHHAPSARSADPRYGLNPGTAGFCNALDDLVQQADFWLHGHLHCRHDYRLGRCRVLANGRGYTRKGEAQGFIDPLRIDLHAPQ